MIDCNLPTVAELIGPRFDAAYRRAAELCALEAGWDGALAVEVSRASVEIALKLVADLCCNECLLPVLSPTVDGHVLLDWTFGSEHVEIEVHPDGCLDVLVDLPDYRDHEFVTDTSDENALGWLAHLVTGVGVSRFNVPS